MNIPLIRQENEYFCGPAIIAMVLGAYGKPITQQEAASRAHTNQESGTAAQDLTAALAQGGCAVEAAEHRTLKDIQSALTENKIVIVCYTEPVLEWGHYAIVDTLEDATMHLIDPDADSGMSSLSVEEFERRWKDPLFTKTTRWAAFVAPPASPRR